MSNQNCATCTNRTSFDARRAFPGVMSADCYLTTVKDGTVSILERSGRYFYASNLSEITSCLLWTDKPRGLRKIKTAPERRMVTFIVTNTIGNTDRTPPTHGAT